MSFRHGKTTAVYLGPRNCSRFLNSAEGARVTEASESTGFESDAKSYIAGLSDGTMTFGGMFDSGTGAAAQDDPDAMLKGLQEDGGTYPATVFMDGGVKVGRNVHMAGIKQTTYGITAAVADINTISVEAQADGGLFQGRCLSDRTPVADAEITGAAADYGNTRQPGTGGTLHVHATANTRNTSTAVTVQQSSDQSVWVDTHTASIPAGDTAGLHIETPGANQRYARVVITPTAGTGTATIVAAFARN